MRGVETIVADITAQIIAGIEAGAGTWEMPWHKALPIPANAATGRQYSGINVLVLWLQAEQREFTSSEWATAGRPYKTHSWAPESVSTEGLMERR